MYKKLLVSMACLLPALSCAAGQPATEYGIYQYLLTRPDAQFRILVITINSAGHDACVKNLRELDYGTMHSDAAKQKRIKVEVQECDSGLADDFKGVLQDKPLPDAYYIKYTLDPQTLNVQVEWGLSSKDKKQVCDYLLRQPDLPADAKCIAPAD
jgi:hypothetical protein